MVWVPLEEAEPIPDISWGVRVLQPPPEQENAQYGEPGFGGFSDSLPEASPSPLGSPGRMVSRPPGPCPGYPRGVPRPSHRWWGN